MTRPASDIAWVQGLHAEGVNQSEIARRTGVSRTSVGEWVRSARRPSDATRRHIHFPSESCPLIAGIPKGPYAYLLGLYLGDGCVSAAAKGVFRLRISCCDSYPHLKDLCGEAMAAVLPNKVGRLQRQGCTELSSYSKHWACLFPQHGPGKKHLRPIVLMPWQDVIVAKHPQELLRGLIHSDGSRSLNRVVTRGKEYAYVRYHFTNKSDDIKGLFCRGCDVLGIEWRRMNAMTISVAARGSVEMLDAFVGPKT